MRILEVGTGSGLRTLALARAMPDDGLLISMEPDAATAAQARQRFSSAGLADRISVIVGDPGRFLHKLRGPFDLIVTADTILHARLRPLLAPRGLLLAVADTKYSDETMTIADWLAQAKADAEKRGLPELMPLLDGLAQATERLRAADWNDDASTSPSTADAADDSAQRGRHE